MSPYPYIYQDPVLELNSIQDFLNSHKTVKIAIHQPGYHRYAWYFYKMLLSDIFISMDTVQYVTREWQNRQLFFYENDLRRLSVPVGADRANIKDKIIREDSDYTKSHRDIIKKIYKDSPFFYLYKDKFEDIYSIERKYLNDLCDAIILLSKEILGINTIYIRASDYYKSKTLLHKWELIGDMIYQLVGPDHIGKVTYLPRPSLVSNSDFYLNQILDESGITEGQKILNKGIDIHYYTFWHPTYMQNGFNSNFIPNLSIVDLLFNNWPNSLNILKNSGHY